ncbi:hypothetical protein [Paraburkholderia sp. SIMBA_027]|uniref:hypothetical protein n=1 Tax=Paraburkholderia sp. SIMBA_027 TaxID=3085770 RepID=UPI0039798BD5
MKTKPSSLLMALERRRTLPDALLETDIITGLRTGELPSPTRLGNSLYFRMRMTGTGPVWRAQSGNTYRDPAQYINREFVSACVGIPLVMDHPASGRIGPDDKIVGTTVAAYTYQAPESPPEVWVISRVLDGGAQETLLNEVMSTSPSVIVGDSPDGFSEGAPIVLDHLALVKQGVWDLGGPPEGIDQEQIFNDSYDEVSQMTKDEMRELIRATVAESLAGKVLADSSPEDFSAKVDALVSQKLDSALAAHNPAAQADKDSYEATLRRRFQG